jgi:hypothetical protein
MLRGGEQYKYQNKKENWNMKYVALWEYCKKDEMALIEKFKKRPEQDITRVSPAFHLGGQTKGLSLYEADNFTTIEKFLHHYSPELNFKVYPIVETTEIVKIRSK